MALHLLTETPLPQMSVGEIVARLPASARVFEKYRIDYCCQGNKPLGRACAEKEVDPEAVVRELSQIESDSREASAATGEENWLETPLAELCDHIERRHQDYLRVELPRLTQLIDKVVAAHGASRPELAQVKSHFRLLRAELEPHMAKEEQVLFPAIRALEQSNRMLRLPFGSLANPIRCMIHEHEGAGDEMAKVRELTGDYTPPAGACPTYRVMLDSLAAFELDLHQHVHKENQILFPRAQALEDRLRANPGTP
jgi:regulator of cell morphogenesis and NO signaling